MKIITWTITLAVFIIASHQTGVDLSEITNLHAQIAEATKASNRLMSVTKPAVQKTTVNSLKIPQLVDHMKFDEATTFLQTPMPERSLFDLTLNAEPEIKKMHDAVQEKVLLKGRKLCEDKNCKCKGKKMHGSVLKERKIYEGNGKKGAKKRYSSFKNF